MEENLNKLKLNEDDGVNCSIHLLVVSCFNAFITLFNSDKIVVPLGENINTGEDSELIRIYSNLKKKKINHFESIKNDYRLINFFCLYKLAELNFDEACSKKSENSETEDDLFGHFSSSLNSLKTSFKAYSDECFESAV